MLIGDRRLTPTDDDATLIGRIAEGDRGAFTALVDRHWTSMYRYASATGRDGAAAEDALQETFAAVWRCAHTYRGEVCVRAWLYAIARNALHHELRRRRPVPEADGPLDDLGAAAGWGDPVAGERVLRTIEDREQLCKAMAHLSDDDRDLLILVDVEELTAEEAAEAFDVGVAALKSRLHRARLRLCALLAQEGSA